MTGTHRQAALIFACLFMAAMAVVFVETAITVTRAFPVTYTWTELLINYEGGFSRRGLLGEIAYQLLPAVSPAALLVALILIAYLAVIGWLVFLCAGDFGLPTLLFLLSPATILFPILDSRAFGRKDIFVLAAYALSVWIGGIARRNVALVLIMLVYLVCGLIAETAWLYFPLAVATLYLRGRETGEPRRDALIFFGVAAAYVIACLAVIAALGVDSARQMGAIIASWRHYFPKAYDWQGALEWLDNPLSQELSDVGNHIFSAPTGFGYLLGFVLANVPAALLLTQRRLPRLDPLTRLAVVVAAFLAMLCPFALAFDWGRYTSLFAIHAFAFLLLTTQRIAEPGAAPQAAPTRALRARRLTVEAGFVLLYFSTWRILHFVPPKISPFYPGLIFEVFGYKVAT